MDAENSITFHHFGYVVPSIKDAANDFASSLMLEWDGCIVHDPLQTVYVTFLRPRLPGNAVMELVQPEGEHSTVHNFCKRGGGLHHLCYEVNNLDEQLQRARAHGDLMARKPLPAAAFRGRRIAWVYTRNRLLLEYLER
jgi:methylmalonyl-CoA/ethylmalonyl-CoA epimerase